MYIKLMIPDMASSIVNFLNQFDERVMCELEARLKRDAVYVVYSIGGRIYHGDIYTQFKRRNSPTEDIKNREKEREKNERRILLIPTDRPFRQKNNDIVHASSTLKPLVGATKRRQCKPSRQRLTKTNNQQRQHYGY